MICQLVNDAASGAHQKLQAREPLAGPLSGRGAVGALAARCVPVSPSAETMLGVLIQSQQAVVYCSLRCRPARRCVRTHCTLRRSRRSSIASRNGKSF